MRTKTWIFSLLSLCCYVLIPQSYPTLCNPMLCSPPGSSVLGILQARILEWVAIFFSWGSSRLRDQSHVSCIVDKFFTIWDFLDSLVGKESACNAGDPGSIPGSWRSAGEGIGYPLQYSSSSLGGSAGKESACNAGDLGSIPELGRSPGKENGNPLQYSCLENSMDRGGLCDLHRVTKSQTWLKHLSMQALQRRCTDGQ